VRNYTIGDVIARYQRMHGRNVLQPMVGMRSVAGGERGNCQRRAAGEVTYENIGYMKQQLQSLGFAIDWTRDWRRVSPTITSGTSGCSCACWRGASPTEDRCGQLGPVDHTVLANEQVIDGRGWRTGALVEKREIPMYYLAITSMPTNYSSIWTSSRSAGACAHYAGELDRKERGRALCLPL